MIRINLMDKKLRHTLANRRWREQNREEIRAVGRVYTRAYYKENTDKATLAKKAWAKANPDKVRALRKASDREWKKNNPDRVKANHQRRRARKRGVSWAGNFTAVEWETLKRQYGYRCLGCWKTESELAELSRQLVPDHIISLKNGGLNHICNIQSLCHGIDGCNGHKNEKYQDFVVS